MGVHTYISETQYNKTKATTTAQISFQAVKVLRLKFKKKILLGTSETGFIMFFTYTLIWKPVAVNNILFITTLIYKINKCYWVHIISD